MGQSTDYLHRLVPLLARRYARCPPARRQATSLREPRGVRFYNEAKLEELNTSMLNTAVSSQKAAFAVFDADHVATYGGFGDFNYGSGISEGDFAKECENSPAVFVDDTLEGLAAQMGIDTTAFTTTIAEYNDHAATGTDADSFGTMPGEKTPC